MTKVDGGATRSRSVEPREAATVALLRTCGAASEVLLTRRPAAMAFAAGMHVFPGGAVDPADAEPTLLRRAGLTAAEAGDRLGGALPPERALAVHVAAIRELFEEAGVLLAEAPGDRLAAARAQRPALLRGETDFAGLCTALDLELRADRLLYLWRWVTPASLPRRFDARFFVAALPEGQEAAVDPGEVEAHAWRTPAAALEAMRRGEIAMWYPTSATLQLLAAAPDPEHLRDRLPDPAPGTIVTVRESRLVTRLVAPNGRRSGRPGGNAYLVGEDELAVIDPGSQDVLFLTAVEGAAAAAGGRIALLLLTHVHPGHAAGVEELADRHGATIRCGPGGAGLLPFPVAQTADGERIRVGRLTLRVAAMPGHAPDHVGYLLEEERLLFAGDASPAEVEALGRSLVPPPGRVFPGHGPPLDPSPPPAAAGGRGPH